MKIEYQKELGSNLHISELFKKGFSAVYIAIGKWTKQQIDIDGNGLPNFYCSDDILVNDKWKKNDFRNAVVIGGGNVAIDVARTLVKFKKNSNVFILYRRTSREMTAWQEDRESAWEEGVIFQFLSQPIKICYDKLSNIERIKCSRIIPLFTENGRKKIPQILKDYDFDIPADIVITALGFKTSKNILLSEGVDLDEDGHIIIDKNFKTNLKNVFAGGDVIGGNRNTVVQAVSDGKKAAVSIHKLLTDTEEKNG
jgi:glutamate synthase (NADPH/NADH) small chain